MRRQDKAKNMKRANTLFEQRCNESMNNLDWGKSTDERNTNVDKYNSLKTDKEKKGFAKSLKEYGNDQHQGQEDFYDNMNNHDEEGRLGSDTETFSNDEHSDNNIKRISYWVADVFGGEAVKKYEHFMYKTLGGHFNESYSLGFHIHDLNELGLDYNAEAFLMGLHYASKTEGTQE